jgi:Flp pilus assembly protein CpaB
MPDFASIFKGRYSIWILALTFALLAGFGTLTLVSEAAAKVTYYVLSQDVASREQITANLLTPKTVSSGGVPVNALTLDQINSNQLFAEIPLRAGDVVTASVVGGLKRITSNLPAGFIVSTFKVSPEDAVGGRIRRGDYVDIASIVNGSGSNKQVAKIFLHHVLILDVTIATDTITGGANASAPTTLGPDSAAIYGGIPSFYTVGLSPQDFTTLALIKGSSLYLGLSSSADPISASSDLASISAATSIPDSGAGTQTVIADQSNTKSK